MTLEKIINSVKETIKDAGKTAIEFCKDNAKVGILLGAGIIGGYALGSGKAEGGTLEIRNYSSALGVENYAYNKHVSGANEANDIYDVPYSNSPAKLHIYTHNNLCGDLYKDTRGLDSITPFVMLS